MRPVCLLMLFVMGACSGNDNMADEPLRSVQSTQSEPGAHQAGQESMANKPRTASSKSGIPLGRLSKMATPRGYAIELKIVPEQDSFSGHVDIAVELHEKTDHVYLHGKDLNVQSVSVMLPDGDKIEATYEQVDKGGVAKVSFSQEIEKGLIALEFDYSALFGTRLHGLFKVQEGGQAYVFSQMESVYAREAIPGFDEPGFKTPFELSLLIKQEHDAIANTPVIEQTMLDDGLKRIRFAVTEPMTTYLLAIAVGPLDIVENAPIKPNSVRKHELPFRGVAAKGKGSDLSFAMAETGAILSALEDYFDMPYPYAKLDIIAVPDFEAGAMENIGAITFREGLLLLKKDAPPQQKRAFTSVMAHELAHMWFGDLVTMPWWDDIWLNESFATWMAYKAVDAYDPTQNAGIAQIQRTQRALTEDALMSARQIREPVEDNDGIVEAFDGITYAKGGAVLSMFEQYVGEDVFREGIRAHVRQFAHANADANDLINSLSKASGKELAPAFETFLLQSGVPLLKVQPDCENGTIKLSQSRFLPMGSGGDAKRLWKIPACIKYSIADKVTEQCVLIEQKEYSLQTEGACPDWVLPNANFSGYFHWTLPNDYYDALSRAGDQLNEREWMSVADSAKAGFASGALSVEQTWAIIEQLSSSKYPSVARAMMPTILFMEEYLGDDPKVRWSIRNRAAQLYKPMQAYRAFDAEFINSLASTEERIHYSNVATFMAEVLQDQETREHALEKAQAYLSDTGGKSAVSKSTLDTILIVGVQDGGEQIFNQVMELFTSSNDAWFRDTALIALARTRDPGFGQKMRQLTFSDDLRSNEIRTLLGAHIAELSNVPPTWDWIKSNFDQLQKKMPPRHVSSLTVVAKKMCDKQWLKPVEDFLRPRLANIAGGPRRLNTALEQMQVCAAAIEQQQPQARRFFLGSAPRR